MGAAGAYWFTRQETEQGPRYEMAKVTQGPLRVTVTATGTLNARDAVDVGSEITGRVLKVLVDFNDKVKAGDVLAEIDTEQYQARLDEARAQLAAAKASVVTAEVSVREAELKAQRLQSMADAGLTSTQELEAALASYERAKASVLSAKAQLTSAQASLKVGQNNLNKAVIMSPIDGIVLDRRVEPGQTVTSGLQTPVLFTLAADLAEMRLDVKVDEADVGQVRAGQTAEFTVDAYPNRVFTSTVLSVKNMPTTDQNVVSYETRLSVRNDEGLLRPGMTATASILVEEKKDALLVLNAALRFRPTDGSQPKAGAGLAGLLSGRPGRRPRSESSARPRVSSQPAPASGASSLASAHSAGSSAAKSVTRSAVWVLEGKKPKRVAVQIGATNGSETAITSTQLHRGSEVIVGETQATDE